MYPAIFSIRSEGIDAIRKHMQWRLVLTQV
jgi:hypothetical protein